MHAIALVIQAKNIDILSLLSNGLYCGVLKSRFIINF